VNYFERASVAGVPCLCNCSTWSTKPIITCGAWLF